MVQVPPGGEAVYVAIAPGHRLVESMDEDAAGFTVTTAEVDALPHRLPTR